MSQSALDGIARARLLAQLLQAKSQSRTAKGLEKAKLVKSVLDLRDKLGMSEKTEQVPNSGDDKNQGESRGAVPTKAEVRAFAAQPEAADVLQKLLSLYSRDDIVDKLAPEHGVQIKYRNSANLAATEFVMGVGLDKAREIVDKKQSRVSSSQKAAETRKRNLAAKAENEFKSAQDAAMSEEIPDDFGRLLTPLRVKNSTAKAVQVEINGINSWLPTSQVKLYEGKYVIGMADWLAQRNGVSDITWSKKHEENLKALQERKRKELEKEAEEREIARRANELRLSQEQKEKESSYLKEKGLIKIKVASEFAYAGARLSLGGRECEVVEVLGRTEIEDSDPSIFGSHLLGYEGTVGNWVYVKRLDSKPVEAAPGL